MKWDYEAESSNALHSSVLPLDPYTLTSAVERSTDDNAGERGIPCATIASLVSVIIVALTVSVLKVGFYVDPVSSDTSCLAVTLCNNV